MKRDLESGDVMLKEEYHRSLMPFEHLIFGSYVLHEGQTVFCASLEDDPMIIWLWCNLKLNAYESCYG